MKSNSNTDVEVSNTKTIQYNNSNPLLTGDLLFQQRIDRAIVQFNSSFIDTGFITGRLGAVESMYLDIIYFLDDEEVKIVEELIEDSQECFSIVCQYRNKENRPETYKKAMQDFLKLSQKAMVILVKKAFSQGHIIKQGDNNKHGRR